MVSSHQPQVTPPDRGKLMLFTAGIAVAALMTGILTADCCHYVSREKARELGLSSKS